jgi:hypothetical protein
VWRLLKFKKEEDHREGKCSRVSSVCILVRQIVRHNADTVTSQASEILPAILIPGYKEQCHKHMFTTLQKRETPI